MVIDALMRGDISERQFVILCFLHSVADYRTGVVSGFRAESVLLFLRIVSNKNTLAKMRIELKKLRRAGWFHTDYVYGEKTPYRLYLHNYLAARVLISEGGKKQNEGDGEGENEPENEREIEIIRPCEITPYTKTIKSNERDDERDDEREVQPKGCVKDQSRTSDKDKPKDKLNNAEVEGQAAELRAFIWHLTGFTRPTKWGISHVRAFSLAELKYAIAEWLWSPLIDGEAKVTELNFFFKEGLDSVIDARRRRNGGPEIPNLTPPTNWWKVAERMEEIKSENAQNLFALDQSEKIREAGEQK
jgi:hypothetical protein